MSILILPHELSYTRKCRPDFWTTSIDFIGKTIVVDESIVVHRATMDTYLEVVGEALYDDKVTHSAKYMGNTELVYETPKSSYYMMYIDPCYSEAETVSALSSDNGPNKINEIASLLSPTGVGVFGVACLVKIDIDENGKESFACFDRTTLAHVIERRLNHTAIEVVTTAAVTTAVTAAVTAAVTTAATTTYREVSITNDLSGLFSTYKSYKKETNEFGCSYMCLGDNTNDTSSKSTRLYIATLGDKKTAIGDFDKEHLKQMLELEAVLAATAAATTTTATDTTTTTATTATAGAKGKRITAIWNKLPEIRNTSAKIRLLYSRYSKAD